MSLTFGSVCSGIEAASVAWLPLGWRCAFMSEIEAFPRAVLAHHYPEAPLHGDFTTIQAGDYGPIDVLVGGTPCQSFSVAGLRGGLADDRGNLALEYLKLANRLRPRWLVWENVPGVLSSNGGRDFGSILGGLVELGYGFAYRVLDAQYFGLAQRRRRVFVVGYLGDWRRAGAVLFDATSLSGNPAPSRQTGEGIAPTISARPTAGGGLGTDFDRPSARGGDLIAFDLAQITSAANRTRVEPDAPASTLNAAGQMHVSGVTIHGTDKTANAASMADLAGSLRTKPPGSTENSSTTAALHGSAVRRLTPTECERLQGFPDSYTDVPYRGKRAADGPRYKALGNSMAVPCMAWIGRRIAEVDALSVAEIAA